MPPPLLSLLFLLGAPLLPAPTPQASGSTSASLLQPAAVHAIHLAPGAVTNVKLADGAVTAVKLSPGAVGSLSLQTGAVGAEALEDGSVHASALAHGAVTREAIAEGAVGPSELGVGSVRDRALAPGSVSLSALSIPLQLTVEGLLLLSLILSAAALLLAAAALARSGGTEREAPRLYKMGSGWRQLREESEVSPHAAISAAAAAAATSAALSARAASIETPSSYQGSPRTRAADGNRHCASSPCADSSPPCGSLGCGAALSGPALSGVCAPSLTSGNSACVSQLAPPPQPWAEPAPPPAYYCPPLSSQSASAAAAAAAGIATYSPTSPSGAAHSPVSPHGAAAAVAGTSTAVGSARSHVALVPPPNHTGALHSSSAALGGCQSHTLAGPSCGSRAPPTACHEQASTDAAPTLSDVPQALGFQPLGVPAEVPTGTPSAHIGAPAAHVPLSPPVASGAPATAGVTCKEANWCAAVSTSSPGVAVTSSPLEAACATMVHMPSPLTHVTWPAHCDAELVGASTASEGVDEPAAEAAAGKADGRVTSWIDGGGDARARPPGFGSAKPACEGHEGEGAAPSQMRDDLRSLQHVNSMGFAAASAPAAQPAPSAALGKWAPAVAIAAADARPAWTTNTRRAEAVLAVPAHTALGEDKPTSRRIARPSCKAAWSGCPLPPPATLPPPAGDAPVAEGGVGDTRLQVSGSCDECWTPLMDHTPPCIECAHVARTAASSAAPATSTPVAPAISAQSSVAAPTALTVGRRASATAVQPPVKCGRAGEIASEGLQRCSSRSEPFSPSSSLASSSSALSTVKFLSHVSSLRRQVSPLLGDESLATNGAVLSAEQIRSRVDAVDLMPVRGNLASLMARAIYNAKEDAEVASSRKSVDLF